MNLYLFYRYLPSIELASQIIDTPHAATLWEAKATGKQATGLGGVLYIKLALRPKRPQVDA